LLKDEPQIIKDNLELLSEDNIKTKITGNQNKNIDEILKNKFIESENGKKILEKYKNILVKGADKYSIAQGNINNINITLQRIQTKLDPYNINNKKLIRLIGIDKSIIEVNDTNDKFTNTDQIKKYENDPNLEPTISTHYSLKTIYDIIHEGFFINETINHMKYFFAERNGKNVCGSKILHCTDNKIVQWNGDPLNYNDEICIVNPETEMKRKEGDNKDKYVINPFKNCLTIPILDFLDELSSGQNTKEKNPSKFVMMCMVRQEPSRDKATKLTLEFADSVKSS
jgi:hypothetical protein